MTQLLLAIVPINDLKTAQRQVVEIYATAYSDIDEFQDAFSGYSNPDLREWAVKPHSRIPNYDPHETVTSLLTLPEKLLGWLSKTLTVVVVVSGLCLSVILVSKSGQSRYGLGITIDRLLKQTTIGRVLPNFETQQNNVLRKYVAVFRKLRGVSTDGSACQMIAF